LSTTSERWLVRRLITNPNFIRGLLTLLGFRTGAGLPAVIRLRVPRVRVRYRNSEPAWKPHTVSTVSRVFPVSTTIHNQPIVSIHVHAFFPLHYMSLVDFCFPIRECESHTFTLLTHDSPLLDRRPQHSSSDLKQLGLQRTFISCPLNGLFQIQKPNFIHLPSKLQQKTQHEL
jgi:hypothetical protein